MNSMEQARSSVSRHMSNSARLAHSRLKPPFLWSQLKLPLLPEVAGDTALSGEFVRELHVPLDESGGLPHELQVASPSDSSAGLARELPCEPPATSGSSGAGVCMCTWKSRQSVRGRLLGPVAMTGPHDARKCGRKDIFEWKLGGDGWG